MFFFSSTLTLAIQRLAGTFVAAKIMNQVNSVLYTNIFETVYTLTTTTRNQTRTERYETGDKMDAMLSFIEKK